MAVAASRFLNAARASTKAGANRLQSLLPILRQQKDADVENQELEQLQNVGMSEYERIKAKYQKNDDVTTSIPKRTNISQNLMMSAEQYGEKNKPKENSVFSLKGSDDKPTELVIVTRTNRQQYLSSSASKHNTGEVPGSNQIVATNALARQTTEKKKNANILNNQNVGQKQKKKSKDSSGGKTKRNGKQQVPKTPKMRNDESASININPAIDNTVEQQGRKNITKTITMSTDSTSKSKPTFAKSWIDKAAGILSGNSSSRFPITKKSDISSKDKTLEKTQQQQQQQQNVKLENNSETVDSPTVVPCKQAPAKPKRNLAKLIIKRAVEMEKQGLEILPDNLDDTPKDESKSVVESSTLNESSVKTNKNQSALIGPNIIKVSDTQTDIDTINKERLVKVEDKIAVGGQKPRKSTRKSIKTEKTGTKSKKSIKSEASNRKQQEDSSKSPFIADATKSQNSVMQHKQLPLIIPDVAVSQPSPRKQLKNVVLSPASAPQQQQQQQPFNKSSNNQYIQHPYYQRLPNGQVVLVQPFPMMATQNQTSNPSSCSGAGSGKDPQNQTHQQNSSQESHSQPSQNATKIPPPFQQAFGQFHNEALAFLDLQNTQTFPIFSPENLPNQPGLLANANQQHPFRMQIVARRMRRQQRKRQQQKENGTPDSQPKAQDNEKPTIVSKTSKQQNSQDKPHASSSSSSFSSREENQSDSSCSLVTRLRVNSRLPATCGSGGIPSTMNTMSTNMVQHVTDDHVVNGIPNITEPRFEPYKFESDSEWSTNSKDDDADGETQMRDAQQIMMQMQGTQGSELINQTPSDLTSTNEKEMNSLYSPITAESSIVVNKRNRNRGKQAASSKVYKNVF